MKKLLLLAVLACPIIARANIGAQAMPEISPEVLQNLQDSIDLSSRGLAPQPADVRALSYTKDLRWAFGVTNNFDTGACLERELHDGQWLAGTCKDLLYFLRYSESAGAWVKAAHLGAAVMWNAEHGNPSYQMKGGLDLGSVGQVALAGAAVVAPKVVDTKLPPWVGKAAHAVSLDFYGGYRPIHTADVNGNWTYGFGASVNVPVQTTFAWLLQGL